MSYSKPKGSGVYDFDEVTEEEAHQMAAAEVRSAGAAKNGTAQPATVSWRDFCDVLPQNGYVIKRRSTKKKPPAARSAVRPPREPAAGLAAVADDSDDDDDMDGASSGNEADDDSSRSAHSMQFDYDEGPGDDSEPEEEEEPAAPARPPSAREKSTSWSTKESRALQRRQRGERRGRVIRTNDARLKGGGPLLVGVGTSREVHLSVIQFAVNVIFDDTDKNKMFFKQKLSKITQKTIQGRTPHPAKTALDELVRRFPAALEKYSMTAEEAKEMKQREKGGQHGNRLFGGAGVGILEPATHLASQSRTAGTLESAGHEQVRLGGCSPADHKAAMEVIDELEHTAIGAARAERREVTLKLKQKDPAGEVQESKVTIPVPVAVGEEEEEDAVEEIMEAMKKLQAEWSRGRKKWKRAYWGSCVKLLRRLLIHGHFTEGCGLTAALAHFGVYGEHYRVQAFLTTRTAHGLEAKLIELDDEVIRNDGSAAAARSKIVYCILLLEPDYTKQKEFIEEVFTTGTKEYHLYRAQKSRDALVRESKEEFLGLAAASAAEHGYVGYRCMIKENVDVRHVCKVDWKLDDVKLTELEKEHGTTKDYKLKKSFWNHSRAAQGGEWAKKRHEQHRAEWRRKGGKNRAAAAAADDY